MRVIVLAKAPVAGRSKTRLQERWSPAQAAALAEAALADTLAVVAAVDAHHEIALDGPPGAWLPAGFTVRPQVTGTHAQRIAAALACHDEPSLLIGMDTPQVTPALLERGLGGLRTHDCALGHATDGGWWALGLLDPSRCAGLVLGVPTSTPSTGARQERALRAAGLRVAMLPTLRDVDLPEDAEHVAALVPRSRFAAVLRTCERAA